MSIDELFVAIVIFLYLLACGGQMRRISSCGLSINKASLIIAGGALALHGLLLYRWIDVASGQNLTILNMLSFSVWLTGCFTWILSLKKPIGILNLFVFPLAALSVGLVWFFPREEIIDVGSYPAILFHILLSLLAFCILCVAGLLAILLAVQEYLLRSKRIRVVPWLAELPPLETMEILLFRLLTWGFLFLTMVLTSSIYFYYDLLWQRMILVQQTLLVIVGWFTFMVLLIGRYYRGWRGRHAIYYTLLGVLFLLGSYFGSKIMWEAAFS